MIAMAQIPISSSSLFFFLANQGGQKTEKYNLQEFRFFFCTWINSKEMLKSLRMGFFIW